MDEVREIRRLSFDAKARNYDAVRPEYPRELTGDLITNTAVNEESKVLEIGPGTGEMTLPLARSGASILGIEIGENLATIALSKLKAYEKVKIVVGDFDKYPLVDNYHNLVIAATSFHWFDPHTRMERVARTLRKDGRIAIIDNHHIDGGTSNFSSRSQECYRRWDPRTQEDYHLPSESKIRLKRWEADSSDFFVTEFSKTYRWYSEYRSEDYINLLLTYSDILTLERSSREGLLGCIKSLIDSEFDGCIVKSYLAELFIAKKT